MKLAARALLAAALVCFATTALASGDDPTGGLPGVVDISEFVFVFCHGGLCTAVPSPSLARAANTSQTA
jgi:hypothetical protein